MTLRLDQSWRPEGGAHGTLSFRIVNSAAETVDPARLCLCSTTRPADDAVVTGGTIRRRFGTYLEFALDGLIPAGDGHEVAVAGLTHAPSNRTHGALSAWLEWADGRVEALDCGDLAPPSGTPRGPVKVWAEGRIESPLALLPWPARAEVSDFGPAPILHPAAGTDPAPFAATAALHRRLFPTAPAPIALIPPPEGRAVTTADDPALPPEGYRMAFGETVALTHADAAGLRHGLVALAQIAHAARTDARFGFPGSGVIEDAPRFAWRGAHLDVARSFQGADTVTRLLDIAAWLKLNCFHWHLTDDEGWRLPSRAFPDLAWIGARRGRGGLLPPQYGDGPEGCAGSYFEGEIKRAVAHAQALGITVMPEIDMPGHATALLHAVPDLVDPGEAAESYHSIQGFPNNALNPGLPRSYEVVETLLTELASVFPGAPLHIGGDEVDAASWSTSPAAQALAVRDGLKDTHEIQAHFMRRAQVMVGALGRTLGAWDEAADGGGVEPEGTVLFAWRSVEKTAELIAAGYDVVATPGQAYYLDMVEGAGWDAPGAAWAGAATPELTYGFDPAAGLPDGPGRLIGVQAGIWTELLPTVAHLNAMLFPRLAAIAETGWTPLPAKSWDRFAALSRLVPQL